MLNGNSYNTYRSSTATSALLLAYNVGFPTFDSRRSDLNTGFCLNVSFAGEFGNFERSYQRELFGHVVNKAWGGATEMCPHENRLPPALGENVHEYKGLPLDHDWSWSPAGPGSNPDWTKSLGSTKNPKPAMLLGYCSLWLLIWIPHSRIRSTIRT